MGYRRRIVAACVCALALIAACGGTTATSTTVDDGGAGTVTPPPNNNPNNTPGHSTTATPTQGQGECGSPGNDARCQPDGLCFAARDPYCCTRTGAVCTTSTVCCSAATALKNPGGCGADGRCECGAANARCAGDADCCSGNSCADSFCKPCPNGDCKLDGGAADASSDGG